MFLALVALSLAYPPEDAFDVGQPGPYGVEDYFFEEPANEERFEGVELPYPELDWDRSKRRGSAKGSDSGKNRWGNRRRGFRFGFGRRGK